MTFCSQSGSAKMMPNSPRLTIAAAMLPLRNEGIAKSARSSIPASPRRCLRRSSRTKTTRATTPTTMATGTGESDHGHDHEPMVSGVRLLNQP